MSVKYWIGAAALGGGENNGGIEILEDFLHKGYFYCWEPDDIEEWLEQNAERLKNQPNHAVDRDVQRHRFLTIKTGDRIAIKRQNIGTQQANILALGVAKTDTDWHEWRVYVNWIAISTTLHDNPQDYGLTKALPALLTFPERHVPLQGLTTSIHGAYSLKENGDLIRSIFYL